MAKPTRGASPRQARYQLSSSNILLSSSSMESSPSRTSKRKREALTAEFDPAQESAAFGLLMLMGAGKKSKIDGGVGTSKTVSLTPPRSPPKPTRTVKLVNASPKKSSGNKQSYVSSSPKKSGGYKQPHKQGQPEKQITLVVKSRPKPISTPNETISSADSNNKPDPPPARAEPKSRPAILKRSTRVIQQVGKNRVAANPLAVTATSAAESLQLPRENQQPTIAMALSSKTASNPSIVDTIARSIAETASVRTTSPSSIRPISRRLSTSPRVSAPRKPPLQAAPAPVPVPVPDNISENVEPSAANPVSVSLVSTVEHLRQAKAKRTARTHISTLADKVKSLSQSAAKVIPGSKATNISLSPLNKPSGRLLIVSKDYTESKQANLIPVLQRKSKTSRTVGVSKGTSPAAPGRLKRIIIVPTQSKTTLAAAPASVPVATSVPVAAPAVSVKDIIVERTPKPLNAEVELLNQCGRSKEIAKSIFTQIADIGSQMQTPGGQGVFDNQSTSIEKVVKYEKNGISVNEISLLSSGAGKCTRLKIRLAQNLPRLSLGGMANDTVEGSLLTNTIGSFGAVPSSSESIADAVVIDDGSRKSSGKQRQHAGGDSAWLPSIVYDRPTTPTESDLTVDIEVTKVKIEAASEDDTVPQVDELEEVKLETEEEESTETPNPEIEEEEESTGTPDQEIEEEEEESTGMPNLEMEEEEEKEEEEEEEESTGTPNQGIEEEEVSTGTPNQEIEGEDESDVDVLGNEEQVGERNQARNIFDDINFPESEPILQEEDIALAEVEVVAEEPKTPVDKANPLQCIVCDRLFKNTWILSSHLKRHAGQLPFQCDVCGHNSSSLGNLQAHLRSHTGEKPFQCPDCPKTFKSKVGLKYHQMAHTGEKPHQCPKCEKAFTRPGILKEHMKIHIGGNKCEICLKSFSSANSYREHLRTHSDDRPYKCQHCHRTFKHQTNLKKHMRVHQGRYQCAHCEEFFRFPSDFEVHDCPTMFKCQQCAKTVDNYADFERHLRTHRADDGAHECCICGKRSQLKSTHKLHMRLHTNERPFECATCGKAFVSSSHLGRHRRVHTGEKPYKCDVCSKRFARHDEKKIHMKQHPPEMLTECELCGENYNSNERSAYNSRKKKTHHCKRRRREIGGEANL